MKIIGFNYDMILSSMCYLNNNKIDYAISEERLSRKKNSRNFPHLSLKNFLKKKKLI